MDQPAPDVQISTRRRMTLKGFAVSLPGRLGLFQLRLQFGERHYCVIELRRGEDAATIAQKLRELAAQVEARSK
jgi:hypothetical protein